MKLKIYSILIFLFIGIGSLSAQITLELRPGHNDALCPGFETENQAIVDVRNMPPIQPGPNTSVEYYWVIQHEDGTWAWQTDEPARGFLVPFVGDYILRCQVLYITVGTSIPYAAFWSSPMLITAGENCED